MTVLVIVRYRRGVRASERERECDESRADDGTNIRKNISTKRIDNQQRSVHFREIIDKRNTNIGEIIYRSE